MTTHSVPPVSEMFDAPILLYDGGCGFCSGIVKFILLRDRIGTLRFAALSSAIAADIVTAHPELIGIDSAVWIEQDSGRVFTHSAAALRVARYLGGTWRLFEVLWIVPRPLRDVGYRFVARHRLRLGLASADDFVPSPEMSERFLDK